MRKIDITADKLVGSLLGLPGARRLALLDSCSVGQPGTNLLIAGIDPIDSAEISFDDPAETLHVFEKNLVGNELAAVFTISYDFGLKIQNLGQQVDRSASMQEPDIYLTFFDCLLVHDYDSGQTSISGNPEKAGRLTEIVLKASHSEMREYSRPASRGPNLRSNFTRSGYLKAIDRIRDLIRAGETYQTNLTQQLSIQLGAETFPAKIFSQLRKSHPAPYAAYIERGDSQVVSASPELFVRITNKDGGGKQIIASPIKGTRPRGKSSGEDAILRKELLASEKDRAENTMIVDLMRNDLGRICEYGSVSVDSLCRLEEHPTLFHLVSTVSGTLRKEVTISEIFRAVFPCGSITGAPKIRTMQIIEDIENANRGLSMGAIGYRVPGGTFGTPEAFEMSVAIRTMVIRDGKAFFNVGGGIVIDSEPASEFDESMLKAKALLSALGVENFDS